MSNKPKYTKFKVIALYPGISRNIGDIIEKRLYANGCWYVPGMLNDPEDYPHLFEPIKNTTHDKE